MFRASRLDCYENSDLRLKENVTHTMANNAIGLQGDYSLLGRAYKQREQLHDAKAMFEKAIHFARKAQSHDLVKEDEDSLNAVIAQMKKGGAV